MNPIMIPMSNAFVRLLEITISFFPPFLLRKSIVAIYVNPLIRKKRGKLIIWTIIGPTTGI
jgi:hypothetical protein